MGPNTTLEVVFGLALPGVIGAYVVVLALIGRRYGQKFLISLQTARGFRLDIGIFPHAASTHDVVSTATSQPSDDATHTKRGTNTTSSPSDTSTIPTILAQRILQEIVDQLQHSVGGRPPEHR